MADALSRHEALHTAYIVQDMIARHLLDQTAVESNPQWKAAADELMTKAYDLYQLIGAAPP